MEQYELEEVYVENKIVVKDSNEVYEQMSDIKSWTKEAFVAFFLDVRNGLISREIISIGTLDSALIHPRELFRTAIVRNAASVVIAHNHPSGDVEPSNEDVSITEKLKEAGKIIGIDVIDHVIVSRDRYHSLLDKGRM